MSDGPARSDDRAVLIAWTDIATEEDEAFNDWYNREHMRDRVIGVPGFIRGRRFVALQGGPKYLALYDAVGPEVLNSPAYLALISTPDPRSRHFILRFERAIRTLGRMTVALGEAEGAFLAVLPLNPPADRRDSLRQTLAERILPDLLREPGLVAASLIERDEETRAASTRSHVRQGDRSLDWALLIEGADLADLAKAVGDLSRLPDLAPEPGFGLSLLQQVYRVDARQGSPAS